MGRQSGERLSGSPREPGSGSASVSGRPGPSNRAGPNTDTSEEQPRLIHTPWPALCVVRAKGGAHPVHVCMNVHYLCMYYVCTINGNGENEGGSVTAEAGRRFD